MLMENIATSVLVSENQVCSITNTGSFVLQNVGFL